MKSYCIDCKKERTIIIDHTICNEKKNEKKILGYCNICSNKLCKIISLYIIKPGPSKRIL